MRSIAAPLSALEPPLGEGENSLPSFDGRMGEMVTPFLLSNCHSLATAGGPKGRKGMTRHKIRFMATPGLLFEFGQFFVDNGLKVLKRLRAN